MTFLFPEFDGTEIIESVKSIEVKPRPYQSLAVDNVYRDWAAGKHSVMIVSATGTGKSVMFSEAMSRWDVSTGGKIILMAHRRELIYQAIGHAKRAGLTSDIEMAGKFSDGHADVVVSTVQTLNSVSRCDVCRGRGCEACGGVGKVKRFTKFAPEEYGLVVVDESHHAMARSYRNVFAWFEQRPDWKRLMVTATPKRADNKGMHNVVDSVALDFNLQSAIEEGWLVKPLQKFVMVSGLDLSKVGTKAGGDLKDGEIEQAFLGTTEEEDQMLHSIARPTIEEAAGRPFLVFAAGKDHAKKLAAAFNSYDDCRVGLILDETTEMERREIIDNYKSGVLNGLINVLVFVEGFDAPKTAVVANCRPTKSETIYLQMIGRGTRPLADVVDGIETAEGRKAAIAASAKPHCVILDFVGNSGRHKLKSVADVLAGDRVNPVDIEEAVKIAKKTGDAVDIEELVEKARQARERKEERARKAKLRREMTRNKAAKIDYQTAEVDLFESNEREAVSSIDHPSAAQIWKMRSLGYTGSIKGMTKQQASGLIGQMIRTKPTIDKFRAEIWKATDMQTLEAVGRNLAEAKSKQAISNTILEPLRDLYARKRRDITGVKSE